MTYFVEFDDVDEFSASVIGEPGSRTFFLNARSGAERVTVKCEKQQVTAISTYLRHVLSDLPPPDNRPLVAAGDPTPADPAFVLGPIGLGYDRRNDRVLVQLEEMLEGDLEAGEEGAEGTEGTEGTEDEEAEPAVEAADRGHIRFYVTRGQADAFCAHADRLVAAGRPPCQWCGQPIDPTGHDCPRMN